jgi:RNA polymerase sigma-70 factor, ECF subfamily
MLFSPSSVYTLGFLIRLNKRLLQPSKPIACTKDNMDSHVQRLLQQGQRDRAFEEILALYETKVYRLVLSMIGNAARSQEVAQDSFFKVWQALESFDGRAALGTWIYTIARNTALTHLRAESYRQTVPLESIKEPAAVNLQETGDVRKLVARLPEEQREVVELYYYQEKSVEDVALMLDLPEGTIKSTYFAPAKRWRI